MSYQDVITVKPDFYKIITDPKAAKLLYDENFKLMIIALRQGPMTIDEIMDYYKENGNEKALKTIYRYIKQLHKADLVVEAGKRVYTDEVNRNKSVTIYTRTAKVFFDKTHDESIMDERRDYYYEVLAKSIELFLPEGKKLDIKKLQNLMMKLYDKSLDYFEKAYNEYSTEFNELLKGTDIISIERFYRDISEFIYVLDNDFKQEILDCTKK